MYHSLELERERSSNRTGPSPIRLISDGGPLQLQNSKDADFVCGKDASKAQMTVPANTSSLVAFNWVGMDGTSAVSRIFYA